MKKKIFIAAAVLISSYANAQTADSLKLLNEVVVTATKFPVKQSQIGKVVTVISKEQIEKSTGKTVAQILNEQAGITVNGAYNTLGSIQTVFLRGASAGRTLILMDGIPVNDPSGINNEFDINLFSINDIERIEICKGAQSTLYGSDAVAGVVNIITIKKEIQTPFNVKTTIGFGNQNTVRNNVQIFGKVGKLNYTTRFAKLKTDGFSSANDKTGNGNFDKDGYDGNVINTVLNYQFTPNLSVKSFVQHSQYKADIDAGVFTDEKDYTIKNKNLTTGFGVNYKIGIATIVANYQYSELSRKYVNDSLFVRQFGTKFEKNVYNGRTQFGEIYSNIKATKWLNVIAGADYRWGNMNQDYFSLSSFGPYQSTFSDTNMHQTSFYASLFFNAFNNKLNIEVGGRTNKHSRYGSNRTFTFNPSYTFNNHWRIFGSIASGFKAPSIYQLYAAFAGNNELAPEKSTNYELGLQQTHQKISSRIVYFYRDINNGIDYDNVNFSYFNFIKQKVSGAEFEVSAAPIKNVTFTANYTVLTGKEQTQSRKSTKDTTYSYLLRRPKSNLNFTVGYQFGKKIFASITAKNVSDRYDVGGYQTQDVRLEKYLILGAYAEYIHTNHIKFFINLQNFTNKKFFDLRGYNSIPFTVNGGVTINL